MKNLLLFVSAVFLAALPVRAQLKQGPEYVWRAQVADFTWKDTLTTPSLVKFPITAFFQYDIQTGDTIISTPSGANLTPPKPAELTVDLLATPTATVTFEYGGKSVTLEYGAVVAAFSQIIASQRSLQLQTFNFERTRTPIRLLASLSP